MKSLESDSIYLTELRTSDADDVYAIYNHPEVLKLYSERPINKHLNTIDFIKKITSKDNLVWSIRLQSDRNSIIGICALHDLNTSEKSIEIGGTLLPKYWGGGIMFEAFILIIEFAEKTLQVNSVIGKTLTKNKQAIRLVEKLGFSILKEDNKDTVMIKNKNGSHSWLD